MVPPTDTSGSFDPPANDDDENERLRIEKLQRELELKRISSGPKDTDGPLNAKSFIGKVRLLIFYSGYRCLIIILQKEFDLFVGSQRNHYSAVKIEGTGSGKRQLFICDELKKVPPLYKYNLYSFAAMSANNTVEPSIAWYESVQSADQLILVLCFLRKKCTKPQFHIVYRELGSYSDVSVCSDMYISCAY